MVLLPGAVGDAASPSAAPRRGVEPLGAAEPSLGTWSMLGPGPSAAELEEAVDLLQDVGEALVFGGAGGQGALRWGHNPVN